MKNKSVIDLTVGSPAKKILLFALPLIAGTLFNQLYSLVDTILVGRLIGTQALAAVGATYSLNFLILGFVQGSTVGFGIPLAMEKGAENPNNFVRYYWNGLWVCLLMAGILTILTVLGAKSLLTLIHTPSDILSMAVVYIRIIFAGIPVTVLNNYAASVLRSYGDSSHPFYFLMAGSLLNIVLDIVCIAFLDMGVAGAAIATVLSQVFSTILCFYWIFFKTEWIAASRRNGKGSAKALDSDNAAKAADFAGSGDSSHLKAWSGKHVSRLCKVGLPMGFEYSISAIGAIILQRGINNFGTAAVAGQAAGEKIRQMFTLPMESVGMAMATYAGQNDGAGKYERIKQGIRSGLLIQLVYCIVCWVVLYYGKYAFTAMILGTSTSIEAGYSIEYLRIISVFFILHGSLMIFRNVLQGMGHSMMAVLSGVGELIGRFVGSIILTSFLGFAGICLANPLAWGLPLIFCALMDMRILRLKRTIKES